MRISLKSCALWAAATCINFAASVDPTDSYMDADPGQSGYLPNHNMDPAVVDSAQFGLLWQQTFNSKEQFYAKPLVFTPSGSSQIVFLASSQNWIRTLDAKNGTLINSRQVHAPFLQADIGCNDIPNTIGITGTPVIDPQTEIAYFFSKTYIPNYRVAGQTGYQNGVYYFHAVRLDTLQDIDGYPILIDGFAADNDPTRIFIGGIILQRPSLVKVGNFVYGGFGGHCDQYNYTGLVTGVDVVQKKVVTQWLAASGPLVPFSTDMSKSQGGGQAGIWMSGFGISTDGNRLFVTTGNGDADENNGIPANGRSGCKTLGEAIINLAIGSNGSLSSQDYFQPYDYIQMDGGDQDFGSSGLALLDPTVFNGNGVNRIGVTAGKNGKWYFVNADNLGGYKTGQGGNDGVLQYIPANKAVFGGAGSYPLEGGYVYLTPVGYPTYAYKLTPDSSGKPQFAPAGQTNETSAGRVGVGIPTVTSLNGKSGTGILWMTDPDAGLRAWYAVPQSNGILKTIKMPQIGGVVKFQRPVFGNTRLYTTDSNGILYCIGSPVNLPLNCSSPVDFGNVALGSVGNATVNCTALIDVTNIVGATTQDTHFVVSNSSLPKGTVKKGTSFSFPVKWDLTNTTVTNQQNVSYGYTTPGVKSTPLTLYTVNSIGGYSTSFPISLIGNQVSKKPYLITAPNTVDFGGIILKNGTTPQAIYQPLSIKNAGLQNMTITGYAWTLDGDDDDDDGPDYTNATRNSNGTWYLGDSFFSKELPAIGTVVLPGQALAVNLGFLPDQGVQSYYSYFNIWTNGGTTNTILTGSATTAPIANMSISTFEGGWNDVTSNLAPTMDFGTLPANSSKTLSIRVCNNGGSTLKISKSKVPNGQFYIPDPTELHEELEIPVGNCSYGPVVMFAGAEAYNSADMVATSAWTLNTNDLNFGVHVVTTKGTIISKKVGPKNSTGVPVYTYLGCFQDNVNGRDLPHPAYNGQNTTNAYCQSLCLGSYYIFAGTEFYGECYCGNSPPNTTYQVADNLCNYPCNGDGSDRCGGNYNNGLITVYYDATKYAPGANTTFGVGGLPIQQNIGNYSYIGCYTEGSGGKALTAAAPAAPTNGTTNMNCMSRCSGYMYFGTEYANECYCGNAISNNASLYPSRDPDVNQCNMACKGNSSEPCGGPSRLTMYQYTGTANLTGGGTGTGGGTTGGGTTGGGTGGSTLVTQQTAYSGNYNYIGCYLDNVNGRALSAKVNPISNGSTVTPDTCAKACSGYQYAGVEYSTECYCDNAIGGNSTVASGGSDPTQNGCNMACGGNSSVYCGGAARLNMYSLSSSSNLTRIVTPVTVGNFGNWSYLGCYTEASNGRALGDLQNPIPSANVSVENCGAACSNYQYFGVEYAGECYCGNTLASTSNLTAGTTPAQTGCNMFCNANSTEYCGGGGRLNLYKKAPVVSSSTSKTTSTLVTTTSSSSTVVVTTTSTATSVTTKSSSSSSSSAATTTSTSSAVTSTSTSIATSTATTTTTSLASSTVTSITTSTVKSSSSSVVTTSSSTIVSTTTTTTTTTTATPTPTGPTAPSTIATVWKYQGCYTEASSGRALVDLQNPIPGQNVSLDACAKACSGYVYFGTEYSSECYCGNYIRPGSAVASGGSDPSQNGCSMTCSANQYQYCGGASRLTLYKSNATAPVTNVTTLQGYTYQGCYQDAANNRTLSASQNPIPSANVSVENCAAACSAYTYFGVEYGGECYCDNAIGGGSTVVNATNPYDTGCNMLCKANSTEYCGGASRLNLYKSNTKSKRDFLEGLTGFW